MKNWHDKTIGLAILCSVAALGCDGADDKADAGPTKADYEKAAAELKDPVAIIAALRPYLGKQDNPKYMPQDRSDFFETNACAANEIRHIANATRQKAKHSASQVEKALATPFVNVANACTKPQDKEDVAKCVAEVKTLDEALKKTAEQSKAAGVSSFPSLDDAAAGKDKQVVKDFLIAKGPDVAEQKLIKALSDPKIDPARLHILCEDAKAEAGAKIDPFEGKSEELRRLAAVHQQVLVAKCTHLTRADTVLIETKACIEKPKPDDKEKIDKCKGMCAESKTLLERGVPAETFLRLKEIREKACEDEDK